MRSKRISQGWDENKACVNTKGKIVSAVKHVCPVNTQPFYKSIGMKGHNGIDWPAIEGEAVLHCGYYDGWLYTEIDPSGGIGVDIISNEPLFFPGRPPQGLPVPTFINSEGVEGYLAHVKLRYWHLKTVVGFEQKQVKYGQVIGLAGNTGASSAPHLHFGFKYCDKDGRSLMSNNGYTGASDPTPFLNNEVFAGDNVKDGYFPAVGLTDIERKQMILPLQKQIILFLRELLYRI